MTVLNYRSIPSSVKLPDNIKIYIFLDPFLNDGLKKIIDRSFFLYKTFKLLDYCFSRKQFIIISIFCYYCFFHFYFCVNYIKFQPRYLIPFVIL